MKLTQDLFYKDLVESANDGIILMDSGGTIAGFNAAAERMFGWDRGEVLGRPVGLLMPERYRAAHEAGVARRSPEGRVVGRLLELEGLRKDGRVFPIELTVSRCRAGEAEGYVGVVRDVTERRKGEDLLRRSEESFRLLIARAPDAVLVHRGGRVAYANPAAARLLGYGSADALVGADLAAMVDPDEREDWRRHAEEAARGPMPLHRHRMLRADGRLLVWEVAAMPVSFDRDQAILVVARDLTERIRAEESLREKEEQLRQAQKLEAVGQLAGGVAHDFNNILTAVLGHLHLVQGLVASADPIQEDLREIEAGCRRAAELTRRLLMFSRRSRSVPRVLDAREALSGLERMLRRMVGEQYLLSWSSRGGELRVLADPAALEQLVLNFVVNSRDAMPEGGEISVALGPEAVAAPLDGAFGPIPPGRYARISVKDAGTGIPPEVLPRIFEPFFTTKPVGKGSGLGLAMVYGVVKQGGAFLRVDTRVGTGTEMAVYWPLTDALVEAGERPLRPDGGAESILLAEDDPRVRGLAQRFLSLAGYQVTACPDGQAALAALGSEHALLFTDVVMPGMSGVKLAAEARAARPGLKVLLTSGYTDETPGAHEGLRLLPKPYTQAELLRAVREALDR